MNIYGVDLNKLARVLTCKCVVHIKAIELDFLEVQAAVDKHPVTSVPLWY